MSAMLQCLLAAVALSIAGCGPPPRAVDASDVMVVADGPMTLIRSNCVKGPVPVYCFALMRFQWDMEGKLYPLPEPDVLKVLEAAHARTYLWDFTDHRSPLPHLGINLGDVASILPVARSYGVRYLIVVHDCYYELYDAGVKKQGWTPLIGGLGISYKQPDNFLRYKLGLTYSVWDCAKQEYLFQTTTEVEASAAPWRRGELWKNFGLAVVQRLQPSATSVVENPQKGDYILTIGIADNIDYWSIQRVQSGTLAISNPIWVSQVQRQGEWVELTVLYDNPWPEGMNFSFGTTRDETFCIDLNHSRYPLMEVRGRSQGFLQYGENTNVIFKFHIPDRNVDFVNFHVPLRSQVGSNWLFKATLTFENVPLFKK